MRPSSTRSGSTRSLPFLASLFSLLSLSCLTACGGGSEADDGAVAASSSPPTLEGPSPAPVLPVTNTEVPFLSNELPEAGSTTAIGNGVEGVWVSPQGTSAGFAFIEADGRYLGFLVSPSTYPEVLEGRVALAGTGWTFASPSTWSISDGTSAYATALFGAGDVMPRHAFQGRYALGQADARQQGFGYRYDAANAKATTQADVAGEWSGDDGIFLSVDASGVVKGSTRGQAWGDCALSGTVRHTDPNTRKNLFAVTLSAMQDVGGVVPRLCLIDTRSQALGGLAAITPSGHRKALRLLVKNGTRSVMSELARDVSPDYYR